MKKLFLFFIGLALILVFQVRAQQAPASIGKQYLEMGDYFRWGNVLNGNGDMEKTLSCYQKSANVGYPDGIAALGEMYERGRGGLTKDIAKALELYTKAYSLGSGRACCSLGMASAFGYGCAVDYQKMISYFQEGAKRGDHFSIQKMGEMLYKGYGVEQSYEKAIPYLERAAEMRNATANYYLGLCYRNGYGVTKDEQKGREYLGRTAKIWTYAQKELGRNLPETEAAKKISGKEIDTPTTFVKTKNNAKAGELDGEWEGYLSFYDWSGKHKLNEKKIALTIKTTGDQFQGTWDGDGVTFNIQGFSNQYGTVFNSGEFESTDHYMGKVRLQIRTGSFESYRQGNKSVLAGNISLFSATEKMPERPTAIVLVKKEKEVEKKMEQKAEIQEPQLAAKTAQLPEPKISGTLALPVVPQASAPVAEKQLLADDIPAMEINSRVWPNPFVNQINVEYRLETACEIETRLIAMDGRLVATFAKEKSEAGLQTRQFTVSVAPGTYVLQLVAKGAVTSHIIIRK